MFNDVINRAKEYLAIGNTQRATEVLSQAWELALGAEERRLCHDLGNAIQQEMFLQYEATA